MNKKQYFQSEIRKIEGVIEQLPWRLDIVRAGKKDVREGIRQEYDRLKESVDAAESRLATEAQKEKKEEEVVKQLESMRDKLIPDMRNMEEQMKELDKEIAEVDETLKVKVEAGRSYIQLVKKLLKNA